MWHKWRTLTAEGTDPSTVAWPDYAPDPDERISSREESYQATLAAGDRDYEASLPEREWRALEPGGQVPGRMLNPFRCLWLIWSTRPEGPVREEEVQ